MIPINNAPTVIPIYLTKLNTPNTFPFICSNLLEIIVDSKAGTIPTQVPNITLTVIGKNKTPDIPTPIS